jgi:starch phosphorylase
MLDVQVKRIHEYKRQLMCCMHAIWQYWRLRFAGEDIVPRTILFGGKAAPGYAEAKRHIKLINDVAAHIDADPVAQGRLKVLFLPNYNVSWAERVIPAADLSEQISMAGKEASGTGNMKFMMNGALTIGTLDGANIEIREEVGAENFFLFGLDAAEARRVQAGGYRPSEVIESSERLQTVVRLLENGFFNPDQRELHAGIARYLREYDPYLVCADFDAYCDAQDQASAAYADPERWWRMAAKNIATSGKFSSDRTIRGYSDEIWRLDPTPISLAPSDG